jgi:disulfide bond formation protein DsbB
MPNFETLLQYRLHIGVLAIVICVLAWATELAELVYICPFCRVQRTIIGMLGLLLLFNPQHWFNRWISSTLAFLGLVVASMQHFKGWAKIMAGEFSWGEYWYANAWVLSGCALFIMTGLILYIWAWRPAEPADDQ